MNIYESLTRQEHLTENEKKIAVLILESPEEFLRLGTKEIAARCFVSVPTIYRLCQKIGVSGLAELKVQMSGSLEEYLSSDRSFNFDYPIRERQSSEEISRSLKEDYEETIAASRSLMDRTAMSNAVRAMQKAAEIDVYTSAGNLCFAENFRFQMQEIGVPVQVPAEEYHQRLLASCSDASHLAVIISFGGRGLVFRSLAEILKENGTPILLISSPDRNPLMKYAAMQLYLCSLENHWNKISSFSTRLSLLYLLDNLYAGYFNLDYQANVKKKLEAYRKLVRGSMRAMQADHRK